MKPKKPRRPSAKKVPKIYEAPSKTDARGSGLEPLLAAIFEDDATAVETLLKRDQSLTGALVVEPRLFVDKINHWLYANDSALHLASAGHRVRIVALLLARGADPNLAKNHRAGRPLHYAADGATQNPTFDPANQVRTIELLLDAGADLHACDKNGATALHRAVRTRCDKAVERLLDAGADPTARNKPGATSFHLAVQNTGRGGSGDPIAKAAQRRIIELMLRRGLDPSIPDARGKSVLDWATSEWVKELLTA